MEGVAAVGVALAGAADVWVAAGAETLASWVLCSATASCCSTGKDTALLSAFNGFLRLLERADLTGNSASGRDSQGSGGWNGWRSTTGGEDSGSGCEGGAETCSLGCGVGGVGGGGNCDECVEDGVRGGTGADTGGGWYGVDRFGDCWAGMW